MKLFVLILNLPWSILGILIAVLSIPKGISFQKNSLIINVIRVWAGEPFYGKRIKGLTLGNIVLKSSVAISNTLEHEAVHIKQFSRFPLIFPLMYIFEFLIHGRRNNKYEKEAKRA